MICLNKLANRILAMVLFAKTINDGLIEESKCFGRNAFVDWRTDESKEQTAFECNGAQDRIGCASKRFHVLGSE